MEKSLLISLFWVPKHLVQQVIDAHTADKRQQQGFGRSQIIQMDREELVPPTKFRMNQFIFPFHEIVVTYGTPNYKEVNPTTFNMVTFPFLFGVMFGDIGHGAMLLAFAIYLCLRKDTIKQNPSWVPLLRARYLILLMGFFATYAGFIYNDMMSLPLKIFPSCYSTGANNKVVLQEDCVYPFGVDPAWYTTPFELNFMNSLKMKIAVILGVT